MRADSARGDHFDLARLCRVAGSARDLEAFGSLLVRCSCRPHDGGDRFPSGGNRILLYVPTALSGGRVRAGFVVMT